MADRVENDPIAELEKKIAAAKKAPVETRHQDDHHSQAQQAWRMVIELVAGILIGFGIGMGLDAVFGTRPIFLVLFVLLGFAAGVRTMLRSAKEMQREAAEEAVELNETPDAGT